MSESLNAPCPTGTLPTSGCADTVMTALVTVYRALEPLKGEQRRRVISAVQVLLPPAEFLAGPVHRDALDNQKVFHDQLNQINRNAQGIPVYGPETFTVSRPPSDCEQAMGNRR